MLAIALGADHAGFRLKEYLKSWLAERGHTVLDLGTHGEGPVDYPDYAAAVGLTVTAGRADRGVLVCGAGIGMAIGANKIPGIRAAACGEPYTARLSREHNDANVLALGARIVAPEAAARILETWLGTAFAGGRHQQRIDKLSALEGAYGEGEVANAAPR